MTDATASDDVPQWATALERANAVRVYRAAVKRGVKAGTVSFADVLADEALGQTPVREALLWVHAIGRTKRDRILRRTRVSPARTLGRLTVAERIRLLAELPPAAKDLRRGQGAPGQPGWPRLEHSSAIATKGRSVTGPRKEPS